MNRISIFTLSFLLICPIAGVQASSAESTNELIETLDLTESLQGNFVQEQYGSDGVLQGTSSGTFKMLRPGYFSWEISSPDSQLILVTPQFLWHLDRDLEKEIAINATEFLKELDAQVTELKSKYQQEQEPNILLAG